MIRAPRLTIALIAALQLAVIGERDSRAQPQRPAFRASIDVVSLSVTAVDSAQRYVTDLTRDEFVVIENGTPQQLTFVARTGVPLALALLIDTSASMEQSLATAQEAAIGFVRQIGPMDLAMVIDFDSRVQTAQSLTNNQAALEAAIRHTTAGGSTALYNAVYITLKELEKVTRTAEPDAQRRRAIIVLSDGDDTSSLVGFDEVLDLASRSDTVIYTIGLGSREALNTRGGQQEGQFILRRLAHQTGGRAFFPQHVKDLAAVYGDIREELAGQYWLAYVSNSAQRDGQWRRVSVRVTRPAVTVRTRHGYFAPAK